jgi:MYXO-CTERM domain-containing protein
MLLLVMAFPHADAHIEMTTPVPVTELMKKGPCGDGSHLRGDEIAVYEPGETITVAWRETINHTSTFRISFDDDGDDAFADPATTTDFYTNAAVLLDEIPDEQDRDYAVEVTLPDLECETCTLQLHQWMQDKPPYTPGGDDIYYQCADLALRAPAVEPEPEEPHDVDESGGCSTTGTDPSWPLLTLLWLGQRRQPGSRRRSTS